MLASFGITLQETVFLAGIGLPTACLSVAVALWLEARSARAAVSPSWGGEPGSAGGCEHKPEPESE